MRVLRIAIAVAVLAAAALALAGSPAYAAKGMEVAVQDDSVFVSEIGMKRKPGLSLADKLVVTRIRVNVPWSTVVLCGAKKKRAAKKKCPKLKKRPKDVRYDFTSYDALINKALSHGMKLQLTISGFAPAWATGNHKVGGYKINVKYFKGFVRAVAQHFRGHIDRYAIWNEPNYISWLGPLKSGAKTYRSMYKTAYSQIRSIDPAAKILFGETAPYAQSKRSTAPLKFIRDVVKGQRFRADGFSHHPYDFRHSINYKYPGKDNVTITGLGRLVKQLDKLAKRKELRDEKGKALNVYLTEYGYMASGKYKVKDSKRASYLTKAFQIALDNSRVKQMLQYLLVKPPPRGAFFDTSIVSKSGKPSKVFNSLAGWAKKQAKAKKIARRLPGR